MKLSPNPDMFGGKKSTLPEIRVKNMFRDISSHLGLKIAVDQRHFLFCFISPRSPVTQARNCERLKFDVDKYNTTSI